MSGIRYSAVIAACIGMSFAARAQVNPKEKLAQALKAIQENYVDTMEDERLTDAAIRGMMKELDPHSRYFSREESIAMRQSMSGSFVGIGVQFMLEHDSLYVTQVIPGGPAEKAGLLAGDRILTIDNEPVTSIPEGNYGIMKKIRGQKGTTVSLAIQRKLTAGVINKEIERGTIPDRSVKAAYMVNSHTGYISLGIFNMTTRTEMDKAIQDLKKQGMESLILDLQGNGGGLVQAAIGVADEFLQKDQLVFYSMGKDKGKDYYYSGGFGNFMTGKLVVLIDQNTASASEILTGALQDWDRAVVVGRRSFGKGLMQRPVDLFDGSVLELTGARYYTPSGRSIQKPYRGADYADNVHTRLASGELTDANVIHFPDSLKYTTLVSKRTVYGGGGIMPDKYVPIDTTEYAGWLQTVTNGGLVNKVTFDYMDSNRTVLMQQYKDFNSFNKQFTVPANLVQEIVTTAEKSGLMLQPRSKDRTLSLLTLDIKGQIAGQLFASNDYYLQVMNSDNNSYRTALEILENPALYAGYLKSAAGVKKK